MMGAAKIIRKQVKTKCRRDFDTDPRKWNVINTGGLDDSLFLQIDGRGCPILPSLFRFKRKDCFRLLIFFALLTVRSWLL